MENSKKPLYHPIMMAGDYLTVNCRGFTADATKSMIMRCLTQ